MGKLTSIWQSSVGKKYIMGLTGLGLFVFVAVHLSENLMLLTGNKTLYNQWTHLLESLGPLLWVIEIGLVLVFLLHVISGIQVWWGKRQAREDRYVYTADAGGPSRKTISSVYMIWTGALIMVFTALHVAMFKYGPSIAEGYTQDVDGRIIRDLHRLVIETFSQGGWVIWYAVIMVLLGLHIRHGFWSAFQSLGAMSPRLTPLTYSLGLVAAVLIGLGFIALPVWIYFTGGVV